MFEAARGQRVGAARTRQQQVGAAAADAATLQRAHLQAAEERKGARDRADSARAELPGDPLVRANRGTGLPARSPTENDGRREIRGGRGRVCASTASRPTVVSDDEERVLL